MLTKSQINLLIIADLVILALALCFVNYSDFDVSLQNHFFNFETKKWLIDSSEPVKRFIFYTFPKILFGILAFVILVLTVISFKKNHQNRYRLLLILLGLAIIPLTVGNVKKITNIYCPNQLALYSGQYPHLTIFEKQSEEFKQLQKTMSPHGELRHGKRNKGQCFPAGHSISGFALMILFFGLKKKSHKFVGLFTSIALGCILGFYQMAKGAHFFGHNLITMIACFLVAALIARIMIGLRPQGFEAK